MDVDYLIVGGGFYGCALSLFLRSISKNILVVESEDDLLTKASSLNQARVHGGFHYPRSALTAVRSMLLQKRFAQDFPEAIVDSFDMLYAVASKHSKVSAHRFFRMYSEMGADISPASAPERALFDQDRVEGVYACTENAFDYRVLRSHLQNQISHLGVRVELGETVSQLDEQADHVVAHLKSGREVRAKMVFNVTYANLNKVLAASGRSQVDLRYELAEIAMVEAPPALAHKGITVVDGPFFSTMPYPAEDLHSLTHVRYTPHCSWDDDPQSGMREPDLERLNHPDSMVRYMLLDARRYVPSLADAIWKKSVFEVKTVLKKNELDDGRPILFHRAPGNGRLISIMGGKIDNIYDLFDMMRLSDPVWANCHTNFLSGAQSARRIS